jgi:hypothetical protein
MEKYEALIKEFESNQRALAENHIWKSYIKEIEPLSSYAEKSFLY